MKIRISRNYPKSLCLFVVYFTLFVGFFTFNFGVTNSIFYVCDAIVIFLTVIELKNSARNILNKPMLLFSVPLMLLISQGSICALFNGFHVSRWLWSIRNWGRLFAFCLITVAVLKKKDCNRICRFTLKLYHINVAVVLFQFLFLKKWYGQDALNGLFGRNTSSIHLTMTFIVVAIATAKYVAKQINWKKFLTTMIEVFIVSIVAELRVIPVIVVIIVAVAYFSTFRLTVQSISNVVLFACAFVFLINCASFLLKIFYPDTALSYTISGIINAASTKGGYGYSGGIDRLTFITVINENIFTNWDERMFGIGVGNAEYSAVTSLCSPFFFTHGGDLGYLNFSSAMIYIETGVCGLFLYSFGFVALFLWFLNLIRSASRRASPRDTIFYEILGCEMTVINIFYIIYNNLQRTDASYLLGFYLAVAFIGTKKEKHICQAR